MNQGRYIAAVILAIAGAIWIGYSFREIRLAHASKDWPKTEGTVTSVSSEVVNAEDRRRHIGPGITTPVWFRISYHFTVESVTYTGDRVYAGQWLPVSAFGARELRARYPQAGEVQVSYDPARPGVSVLEPGFDSYFAASLVAGYVVLLVSIFVLRTMFKTQAV